MLSGAQEGGETHMAEQIQQVPIPEQQDYQALSNPALTVAAGKEVLRLLVADAGHGLIQGWLFAWQVLDKLRGEREEEIEWEPDPRGVSPKLDALEDDAHAKLRAIRHEMNGRRTQPN